VPAFDTLDAGDLVIVPARALAVVGPTDAGLAELATAFARARAGGVLVVGAEGPPTASGSADAGMRLAAAAADAGLPAFRMFGVDPAALERSIIGCLVDRGAELERQASALEQRLERLALGEADVGGLVAAIAGFLGRAVALENGRGDALAVHAPTADADAAIAVGRYLTGKRRAALRVRLPGPPAGATDGRGRRPGPAASLALLGERPATELERIVAERLTALLALELDREEAVRRATDATRRAEALPSDGPPWVVAVARQAGAHGSPSLDEREATRRDLRQLAPNRRLALRGTAESLELRLVLAADETDPGGLALADRVAALIDRRLAVSRPFALATDRAPAEAEARATLEAVEALAAVDRAGRLRRVVPADRLAAYRLLGATHNLPDGVGLSRALLAPLLDGRPAAVRDRLATLRAVLDTAGPTEAALALGIHRNTLAYRVRRIESLSGWRLTDPDLRLALAVAVRLVQSARIDGTEQQP
jgi:hypothetical protein